MEKDLRRKKGSLFGGTTLKKDEFNLQKKF